ncbi:trafficking protein particle complex subunit 2-like protein isoform X2 [Tachypleus tridentatus]|uniref:trafficking protein particle complex subunit 2-like protein isoform X2 n=1 Tax=Tachypleus tridentatus TaxID=6853 RepID=UPI003FD0DAC3
MAVAVAVIGKENSPLFVRTVNPSSELKFMYTIHASLDVVEEKVTVGKKSSGELRELYLGLLYPTEDYKVYGYVTNTRIKFIIIVESSYTTLRDNDIRQCFPQFMLRLFYMIIFYDRCFENFTMPTVMLFAIHFMYQEIPFVPSSLKASSKEFSSRSN